MSKTEYTIGGPSRDGKYGILAIEHEERHFAALLPFADERDDVSRMADLLSAKNVTIDELIDLFESGELFNMTAGDV